MADELYNNDDDMFAADVENVDTIEDDLVDENDSIEDEEKPYGS